MSDKNLIEDWTALGLNTITGWEAETEQGRKARRYFMRQKILNRAKNDLSK